MRLNPVLLGRVNYFYFFHIQRFNIEIILMVKKRLKNNLNFFLKKRRKNVCKKSTVRQ